MNDDDGSDCDNEDDDDDYKLLDLLGDGFLGLLALIPGIYLSKMYLGTQLVEFIKGLMHMIIIFISPIYMFRYYLVE